MYTTPLTKSNTSCFSFYSAPVRINICGGFSFCLEINENVTEIGDFLKLLNLGKIKDGGCLIFRGLTFVQSYCVSSIVRQETHPVGNGGVRACTAVVLDTGSDTTRAGYSGDDHPRPQRPSTLPLV